MTDPFEPPPDPSGPGGPVPPQRPGANPPPPVSPPQVPPPQVPPSQVPWQPPGYSAGSPVQPPAYQQPTVLDPSGHPPTAPPGYQPPASPPGYSAPVPPPGYQPPVPPPGYQPPVEPPGYQPPGMGGPPGYGGGGSGPNGPGGGDSGSGRRGVLWVVLGAFVALLAGVGGYLALRSGDDDEATMTTTTTAADTTTTTAAETTTTTARPLTAEDAARSVVEIITANGGVAKCGGSGTIISADGLILTNAHVVDQDERCAYDELWVAITTSSSRAPEVTYLAEVYALDDALDLAVIGIAYGLDGNPITVSDLPVMPMGDSDSVGLGDEIQILGYPGLGGVTITHTAGSVSGFVAEAGVADDRAWIKTDATVTGGNSGGAALNRNLEIIGVPTQVGGGADTDAADCRVVADTNGDGVIDDRDTCIPIGGFINGVRPVNLARDLITQAQARVPVVIEVVTPPQEPAGDAMFFDVVMTSDIVDDRPVDNLMLMAPGTVRVCAAFSYENMAPGAQWDALWFFEGELNEELSFMGLTWTGGANGDDWWVCTGAGGDSLPEGLYELGLYIEGEYAQGETVHIGEFDVVELTLVNDLAFVVCYLQISPSLANGWGPDDLGPDEVIQPGEQVTIRVVAVEAYDFQMWDCAFSERAEVYEVLVFDDEVVYLSGSGG